MTTAELTTGLARDIFDLLILYGSVGKAYIEKGHSGIDYENMVKVDLEIKRILVELNRYKSGGVVLVPATEESEAVYYQYTTDKDLCEQVVSDLLDVELVWNSFKPVEE